jgi:hypothetical protein
MFRLTICLKTTACWLTVRLCKMEARYIRPKSRDLSELHSATAQNIVTDLTEEVT